MRSTPNVLNLYPPHRRAVARLSPEEDALIIGGALGDDDIDETLPADLWFRSRLGRARSAQFKRFESVGR